MSDQETTKVEEQLQSKKRDWTIGLSILLWGLFGLTYNFRPDPLAAITIWPHWVWGGVPGFLFLYKLKRNRLLVRSATLSIWVIVWIVTGDSAVAMLRDTTPLAPYRRATTVVTLNCAGGSIEAAREVMSVNPNIVLLQEAPSRDEIVKWAGSMPGEWSYVIGPDAAILAMGNVSAFPLPRGTDDFVAARVQLTGHIDGVVVVSLRLTPPVLRFDYLNPSCWSDYRDNKVLRRKELDTIIAYLNSVAPTMPVIIGGDFNSPPDPTITLSLSEIARDTFKDYGRGWGATAVNDYPIVRIDQIWASAEFDPIECRARKTVNSDHRMTFTVFSSKSPAWWP